MRTLPVWILVLAMAACGEDRPAPTAPETEPEAEPEAQAPQPDEPQPDEPPPTNLAPTRTAPSNVPSADVRREARTAVVAGRRAQRGGDLAAARVHFERALELMPLSPRVHCEAGFVALPSDTEYAEAHINLGIALFGDGGNIPERLRVPYAMCLYNGGLLAEEDEDLERARHYYARSLSHRPNAVVQRRLEALGDDALLREDDGTYRVASLDELIEPLASALVCDDPDDDYCSDGGARVLRRREASDGAPEVGWVVTEQDADLMATSIYYVAFHVDGGYRLSAGWVGSEITSDHGVDGSSSATPGDVTVISPSLLRFDFEHEASDGYWSTIEAPEDTESESAFDTYGSTSQRGTGTVICDVAGARCATTVLSERSESGVEIFLEDGEEEPAWVHDALEAERSESSWELAIEIDPERGVRTRVVSGEIPEDNSRILPRGRWIPLDEVFELLPEVEAY